jgi:F1F0 ATPase subunit 2
MVWREVFLLFLAGSLLGAFFFGGLWWTVRRLPQAKSPALLALLSFAVRLAAVLGAFYLILTRFSGAGWLRLVVSLAGFVLIRLLFVSRLRPRGRSSEPGDPPPPLKEVKEE